jgi:ABC-type lipoprotein release transport system permease subunit
MNFLRGSFYENLKMALNTLRGNKLRSFLTIFGVIIGVITVMLISSVISGIDVAVKKQVESSARARYFCANSILLSAAADARRKSECENL